MELTNAFASRTGFFWGVNTWFSIGWHSHYLNVYDPRPGHALSLAPGKRVTTSMSPMMALRDGKLVYALGLPGGKRIFPSAMQALINLIDHGMNLQEAVEAPRIWTEGNAPPNSPQWATRCWGCRRSPAA